jgi:hypothetical protein
MRRLLLILAVVCALATSTGAQASTSRTSFTLDTTFTLCNGDPIDLNGRIVVLVSETQAPGGVMVLGFHFQPQGVTGVDLVTGTVFEASGLTRDLTVSFPSGGGTETFVNQFRIQATRGAQGYLTTELFHITVTPGGTVAVALDNFSTTC